MPTPAGDPVNALRSFNVHSIAIQIDIGQLANNVVPTDPTAPEAVIGVWTTAARQKGSARQDDGTVQTSGPYVQVSRLGNPLINEVLIPVGLKDRWNHTAPADDAAFTKYVAQPELAKLLPVLYPDVFPNLASVTADRADLLAILMTGIPNGIVPGFQNFTGATPADMLRLNMAIPPTAEPNINGILGGDLAGFPNGRRVFDNVVAIELRAVAGAALPLVDPTFTPDDAAGALYDVTDAAIPDTVSYLDAFPYLDHPVSGYDVLPLTTASA